MSKQSVEVAVSVDYTISKTIFVRVETDDPENFAVVAELADEAAHRQLGTEPITVPDDVTVLDRSISIACSGKPTCCTESYTY